jgi:uridine phosphorylase
LGGCRGAGTRRSDLRGEGCWDMERIPLLEFDSDTRAIIEPSRQYQDINPPEHCVMPIYRSLIEKLRREGRLEKIHQFREDPPPEPVYVLGCDGRQVVVANPGIGAPFAAAVFEVLIALGCRKFVACGSAGVLKPELERGAIVVPNSAIRDEGTSYHYCPPSRAIDIEQSVVSKLESVLRRHHVPYEVGRTWTTDAFFRETTGKIAERKAEGCLTVEMECSALVAVARFRGVTFGQYLVAVDDVSGEEWDRRHVDDKVPLQERVFWLSVEACLSL